jgi:hypothetical protein
LIIFNLRGTGFKVIPLWSSLIRQLIALLLIVPSLWNVALSKLPTAATVVAASWAEKLANHDVIIRHNTVVAPILANGVAIYGGHDIVVSDNLISDTLTEGGGLHLGNLRRSTALGQDFVEG